MWEKQRRLFCVTVASFQDCVFYCLSLILFIGSVQCWVMWFLSREAGCSSPVSFFGGDDPSVVGNVLTWIIRQHISNIKNLVFHQIEVINDICYGVFHNKQANVVSQFGGLWNSVSFLWVLPVICSKRSRTYFYQCVIIDEPACLFYLIITLGQSSWKYLCSICTAASSQCRHLISLGVNCPRG